MIRKAIARNQIFIFLFSSSLLRPHGKFPHPEGNTIFYFIFKKPTETLIYVRSVEREASVVNV